MKKKLWRSALGLLLALVMVLAVVGCGSSKGSNQAGTAPQESAGAGTGGAEESKGDETAPPEGQSAGGTVPGTVLNLHMASDPGNFAPLGSGGNQGFELSWQIFEGLVVAKDGDYGNLVPGLAEEFTISEDGMTYTFKLRQGVTFHNGDPLTVDDVLCTFSLLAADANASGNFSVIESYEATDDQTIVCHLSSPAANLLAQFAHPSWGIIDHNLYEKYGYTEDIICGTGPYYLDSYTVGSQVVLKAYQDYWGEPANVETLNFMIISDSNTAYLAFLAGDLDTFWSPSSLQILENMDNPDVNVVSYGGLGNLTLFMNMSRKPFDDLRVRQAFSYLIDRNQAALAGFGELGVATTDYFGSEVEGSLTEDQYTVYEYDQEKGLALLKEAGYEPSDISFTLMTSSSVDGYYDIATNVQAQLLQLGMNVEVISYEWPTFRSIGMDGDFDALIFSGNASISDPIQTYQVAFTTDAGWNCGHLEEVEPEIQAQIDSYVSQAAATIDREARIALLEQASMLMHEQINGIPLAKSGNHYLYRNDLKGYGICLADGQCKWATAYLE